MPLDTPRFGLNGLDFLETSPSVIRDEIIAKYQEASGRTLAQGDPLRLVLESVAAYIAQLSKAVQLACRNNLLSYATGDYLDPMGYYVNTPRLEASKASVTLKFTLAAAQNGAFQIPAGTQVSDGARYGAGQAIVTPSVIRSELIAQYAAMETDGLVENAELFAKYLIVERNTSDPNRIDVLLPPDLVNQLRIFALQNQFRLQYPENA